MVMITLYARQQKYLFKIFSWWIVNFQCCIISGVEQSDSFIHIFILLIFFAHIGYHRILKNRVPFAIKYVLLGYLSYI